MLFEKGCLYKTTRVSLPGWEVSVLLCNGPFAAERSLGWPNWWANDALGHVKQRKFKFGGFFQHVPVHHLLTSLAIFVPRDRPAAKGPLICFFFLWHDLCVMLYGNFQFWGVDWYMKQTRMLIVSLTGVKFGFWSRLGCSGQSGNILSHQGLV